MRAWVLLPLLALVALPAAGLGGLGCLNERDPSQLPLPREQLAQAQALGLDLSLAEPLPALSLGEQPDNHPCMGKLRPGAQLIINNAALCTANWVYRDEAGALYLGTAGHCAVPGDVVASPGVASKIGDVAFSTGNGGVGNDFALIRIDPALYSIVTPTMCHWGGPVAVSQDSDFALAPGFPVLHYGWGLGLGQAGPATRPRAGFTQGRTMSEASFVAEILIGPGDSGSAIQLSSGRVVGIVTHGLILPQPAPNVGAGLGLGTRVQHGLALAGQATGHTYSVLFSAVPVDLTGTHVP